MQLNVKQKTIYSNCNSQKKFLKSKQTFKFNANSLFLDGPAFYFKIITFNIKLMLILTFTLMFIQYLLSINRIIDCNLQSKVYGLIKNKKIIKVKINKKNSIKKVWRKFIQFLSSN